MTNPSSFSAEAQAGTLNAARVARIASEIAVVCQSGIANIAITPQGTLAVAAPAVEDLARQYCRATKLRPRGSPAAVQKLLRDGLRGLDASRKDLDYAFIMRISFGPTSGAQAELEVENRADASGENPESDSWAEPYSQYIGDYAICLIGLVQSAKKRRQRIRWVLSFGAIFLPLTVFHLRPPAYPSWVSICIHLLSAIGIVVCAWLLTRYRYARDLRVSSVHKFLGREIVSPPNQGALSLQLRAGTVRPIGPLEAEIFALALINPAALRQRVSERYEPERRTLWQRVTVEVQIPGELIAPQVVMAHRTDRDVAADEKIIESEIQKRKSRFSELGRIPFPVIIPPKAELNDEIVVLGTGGDRVPCFSYPEYLLIIASVLRMLLLKAYRLDNVDHLPKVASNAERQALGCIMQRGSPPEAAIKGAVDAIRNLPRAQGAQTEGIRDLQAARIAAELVRKLSDRYAIVASLECTPEGRMVLEYQRKIVPTLELSVNERGGRFRWLQDRLSIFLGARPVDLALPIENAPTCQSFHLYVDCPEGLYLRKQQLIGLDEYLSRNNRQASANPPYYRLRRRLGQPYAHLYARFFPTPNEGEVLPELRVSFWEVPPGSLFRAAIVSISTVILVWLVGWLLPRAQDPGTDVPAVLLAFPAVAAAWLGIDEKRRRLLEGTLASRISLTLSAISALAASSLFMLNGAHLPVLHDRIPFPIDVSFLGINQASWGILVCLTLINSLGIGYLCLLRTWEWGYLAARPDPMSSVRER